MMAKITKGNNFGGAVRYVTQEKKDAKLTPSVCRLNFALMSRSWWDISHSTFQKKMLTRLTTI